MDDLKRQEQHQKQNLSEEQIKKSLDNSTKDGIAATVTINVGDHFVSPFAVALNASNFQIGLLSALPNLIPSEIFTSKAMEKFSRKKIVLTGVLMQVICWFLIALLAVFSFFNPSFMKISAIILIVLFTATVSAGLFMSPAWNSWMKDLTEKIKLGKYFGNRNKIFGIVGLISVIAAGFVLDLFKDKGHVFFGFALLFVVASFARYISRCFLSKQGEPELKIKKEAYFSFWQFIKKAPANNWGKFAIFIALINLSISIAGPFFAPYVLNELKFDYITYTIVQIIVSATATLITMPFWGRFIDKYGCVKTMKVTAWAIPVVPILWLFSPSVYWIVFAQIFSGVIWAGFNLAAGTFTYHAVTKDRMSLCVAYLSILNGIGVFLGSTLGGIIASLNITFMNIFLFVFLVSGIARLIVILPLLSTIKEVKPVEKESLLRVILKPLKTNYQLFSHVLSSLYLFSKFKQYHNSNQR